jgi:hypothetical protein
MMAATAVALASSAMLMIGCATSRSPGSQLVVHNARLEDGSSGSCLERERLLREIRARLGFDPARDPRLRGHQVRVDTLRLGSYVKASVRLTDGAGGRRGQRTLTVDFGQCDDLHQALALAISMALQAQTESDRRAESGRRAARLSKRRSAPSLSDRSAPALSNRSAPVYSERKVTLSRPLQARSAAEPAPAPVSGGADARAET